MLKPRRNPFVDQNLVVTPLRTYHRARQLSWLLIGLILLTLLLWTSLLSDIGRALRSEQGWRDVITQIADKHFQKNLELERSAQLSEHIKTLEAERLDMQSTIQGLEKLVQGMRMEGWLHGMSARRSGNGEIEYELLLTNPEPGNGKRAGYLAVTVRGIDRFDPEKPELALAEAASRNFRSNSYRIRIPATSEAIKGRLSSNLAHFLIISVVPEDDSAGSEISIVPIRSKTPSRSP